MTNAVTLSMNNNLKTEVVGAIADALRETANRPEDPTAQGATGDLPNTGRPFAGVLRFIADLLSNSARSKLFEAGRPEDAMLRGTLAGLASGVEAVTDAGTSGDDRKEGNPFGAIVTVSAYVLGGVAVALLVSVLRSGSRMPDPSESSVSPGNMLNDSPDDIPRTENPPVSDARRRDE